MEINLENATKFIIKSIIVIHNTIILFYIV